MDIRCPICGEPWDHDCLHDEAAERYGIPYYVEAAGAANPWDRGKRDPNPAYDGAAYARVFELVSRDFRRRGCAALESYGCSPCSAPAARVLTDDGRLAPADVASIVYELCGDDLDGAASMLADFGY